MISIQLCYALIYGSCALGIIYAVINYLRVRSISLKEHTDFEMGTMPRSHDEEISLDRHRILAMVEIGEIIAKVTTLCLNPPLPLPFYPPFQIFPIFPDIFLLILDFRALIPSFIKSTSTSASTA